MLLATLSLWVFIAYASTAATSPLEQQLDQGIISKARCGAVNFLVTAFLPQPHATALCSAYLQVSEQTVTSTNTVEVNAMTVTETSNKIVATLTKTVSTVTTSISTRTVDLWTGTPACSTIPSFQWLRERQQRPQAKPIAVLEQACNCLVIPVSTRTVQEVATSTPILTITEGLAGLAEVTSTIVLTAVETRTRLIFLIDRPEPTVSHGVVASEGEKKALEMPDHEFGDVQRHGRGSNNTGGYRDISGSRLVLSGLKSGLHQSPIY